MSRIQTYATEKGISETEAATRLLTAALEAEYAMASPEQTEHDKILMLGDHIRDLREQVSTLRGQLVEKDKQIASALQVASNAQLLEGVHVAGSIGEDVTSESEPASVWDRLWRRVRG